MGAGTWHSPSASDINAMEDTYMAPFRTIANERWRPGCVPASSQEGVSSIGHSRFRGGGQHAETSFGCTAGTCIASPSLMTLLQSDACRESGAVLRH